MQEEGGRRSDDFQTRTVKALRGRRDAPSSNLLQILDGTDGDLSLSVLSILWTVHVGLQYSVLSLQGLYLD